MKGRWYMVGLLIVGWIAAGCVPSASDQSTAEHDAVIASEWVDLLADGSLVAWRGYQRETAPEGWQVEEGALTFNPEGERGDLMTRDSYGSFELALEWKITEGGNSGIIYRVSEEGEASWHTGPEFQVLDNDAYREQVEPHQLSGANYAINAPSEEVVRPVGEWNTARIVVQGNHVEHWLNGTKIVEYEIGSADWEARVQASKFVDHPGYGRQAEGHIVLQDHSDPVWYRNIRIRDLGE